MRKRTKKNKNAIDPISLEVARTRLEAIVEEMGATLLRTAHSSIYVECRDYSVAILNLDGGLVAMGQFIPHHQGGMQAALKSIIELRGLKSMRPGDIYITNDAYMGGTHTLDVNLFMPLFHGGELVCFCGAAAHQIDLGGGAPGSYVVGATEVFQEGIVFPRMKVGENGEYHDDFVRPVSTQRAAARAAEGRPGCDAGLPQGRHQERHADRRRTRGEAVPSTRRRDPGQLGAPLTQGNSANSRRNL